MGGQGTSIPFRPSPFLDGKDQLGLGTSSGGFKNIQERGKTIEELTGVKSEVSINVLGNTFNSEDSERMNSLLKRLGVFDESAPPT